MKQGLVDITVLLDRSGSMGGLQEDTIGGFNSFIKAQKAAPGEATLTVIQFADTYSVTYTAKDLRAAPNLTQANYNPTGPSTALRDSLFRAIEETGARLAAMPEEKRPEKVIFLTITDGMENASRRYSAQAVKNAIEHQREVYKWEFVYIGANHDVFLAAAEMGIPAGNVMAYNATPEGTEGLYATASAGMLQYRSQERGATMNFFGPAPDKELAVGKDAKLGNDSK